MRSYKCEYKRYVNVLVDSDSVIPTSEVIYNLKTSNSTGKHTATPNTKEKCYSFNIYIYIRTLKKNGEPYLKSDTLVITLLVNSLLLPAPMRTNDTEHSKQCRGGE